jgi:hypothetical protein
MRRTLALLIALVACVAFAARADEARADEPATPTRALRIGATGEGFLSNPFGGVSSSGGAGLGATYEFLVSPRTSVGLALSGQLFFGTQNIMRLVYGAEIKHYFSALDAHAPPPLVRPYVAYGLLQQLIDQRGHTGSAVAYDAGLIAGADFGGLALPLFAQAAVHVSHLTGLDVGPRNATYAELGAGVRLSW